MSLESKKRQRFSFLLIFCVLQTFCFGAHYTYAAKDSGGLFHKQMQYEEGLVLKVVASDTIVLENGQRIKLLGVDSYGSVQRPRIEYDSKGRPIEKPVEPTISMEEQALAYAQNLMEGKKIKLEFDLESRDDRGNKTAYVYLSDGLMVNVELLRQGFVKLQIRPPNVRYAQAFKEAYQEARKEQRGFLSD